MRKKQKKEGIAFPSNESVTVELVLSDEQINEFLNLDLSDNYDYEIADNTVLITYTDIDEVFNQLSELQGKEMTLLELSNEIQKIENYDVLCFVSESVIIDNGSISVSHNDLEYNVIFEVVEFNEEKLIDTILEVTEIEYI